MFLDRDASNAILYAIGGTFLGPALAATLHCMRKIMRDKDLDPTRDFLRGYRLNVADILWYWVPAVAMLTILLLNLGSLDARGSAVDAALRIVTPVVVLLGALLLMNMLVISTAFNFRLRDLARLSVFYLGRSLRITFGNLAILAERYSRADDPASGVVVAWHVNNEYGGTCYCEHCAAAFRVWLQERYATLEVLNAAWNTVFWSHTFRAWEEIVPPNALSEHWNGPNVTAFQGITLDYPRFNSDGMLQNFIDEKAVIREFSPHLLVTTNFMGMYRPLDYFRWAPHLDMVSWDNYPPDMRSDARMALTHDLMRGLKGGLPFWLMEQTPSRTSSRSFNPVKRPEVMRLWSYQAVAHGADAVLFFQMRQSRGASEKDHGALINHAGRSDTRVFREVVGLGKELEALAGEIVGARLQAKVALVFDWDSWWAVEIADGPSRHVSYQQTLSRYYRALYTHNVGVDVVPVDADLLAYEVVVAPLLHMVKGDFAARVEVFVEGGGVFVTSFLSGWVDESDNAFELDAPGPFARILGIRIDETDALAPGI